MNKKQDIIVEAFLKKYGMLNLLKDVNVENIRHSSKSQILALCPFHDDSHESFSVNIESGLFTCFSCDSKAM